MRNTTRIADVRSTAIEGFQRLHGSDQIVGAEFGHVCYDAAALPKKFRAYVNASDETFRLPGEHDSFALAEAAVREHAIANGNGRLFNERPDDPAEQFGFPPIEDVCFLFRPAYTRERPYGYDGGRCVECGATEGGHYGNCEAVN